LSNHTQRPCRADDLYRIEIDSDPHMSPDGTHVVFVRQRVDRKTQRKLSNLWTVPVAGGTAHAFTQGDHVDHSPRFSPDGRTIAFLSNRADEKQFQVYLIPTGGGEARRLSEFSGAIQSVTWSRDGRQLALAHCAKDEDAIERDGDEQKKKLGTVSRRITRLFFKLDELGYKPTERWQLWTIDVETGHSTQRTHTPNHDNLSPAWSADGCEILFVSNRSVDPDRETYADDLYWLSLADHTERRVNAPFGPKSLPSVSPDGRWIAYYGAEGKDPWALTRLWIAPTDGSELTRCLTKDSDVNISSDTINDVGSLPHLPPTWSADGDTLYVHVAHHGRTRLCAVDRAGSMTDRISKDGVVGAYSFDRNAQHVAYFEATMQNPGRIAVRDGFEGSDRVLVQSNEALLAELDLGTVEEVWFKGPDDNDLQGWILTPPGFDEHKQYPAILEIHGGPQTQYGHFFMHEFHVLAAHGYVVFFCNPRGGQGYGDAHCRGIANDWGNVDYADLMAWTDLVASRPYVDEGRLGVTGGSYGGFMTNWIIGHTDRFKAAVTQRCVSNLISMWGSSDFCWAFQDWFGDRPPWEGFANYWRQSPMAYIGNARTPTLVIHSEGDMRCAIEQGEQIFVALKVLGVDTEMIRYPDEPHGLSRTGRTDRRIDRLGHIVRWFDTYVKPSTNADDSQQED